MDIDAEAKLDERIVSSNNGSANSVAHEDVVVKEKTIDSPAATSSKVDSTDIKEETDDLLERLEQIDTSSVVAKEPTSLSLDADLEQDDLIQRLEAIEKGEADPVTSTDKIDNSKKPKQSPVEIEIKHQNGECSSEAESKIPEATIEDCKKAEDNDAISSTNTNAATSTASDISNSKESNIEESDLLQENGNEDDVVETTSATTKRRHSEDDPATLAVEPVQKKSHVEDIEGVSSSNDDILSIPADASEIEATIATSSIEPMETDDSPEANDTSQNNKKEIDVTEAQVTVTESSSENGTKEQTIATDGEPSKEPTIKDNLIGVESEKDPSEKKMDAVESKTIEVEDIIPIDSPVSLKNDDDKINLPDSPESLEPTSVTDIDDSEIKEAEETKPESADELRAVSVEVDILEKSNNETVDKDDETAKAECEDSLAETSKTEITDSVESIAIEAEDVVKKETPVPQKSDPPIETEAKVSVEEVDSVEEPKVKEASIVETVAEDVEMVEISDEKSEDNSVQEKLADEVNSIEDKKSAEEEKSNEVEKLVEEDKKSDEEVESVEVEKAKSEEDPKVAEEEKCKDEESSVQEGNPESTPEVAVTSIKEDTITDKEVEGVAMEAEDLKVEEKDLSLQATETNSEEIVSVEETVCKDHTRKDSIIEISDMEDSDTATPSQENKNSEKIVAAPNKVEEETVNSKLQTSVNNIEIIDSSDDNMETECDKPKENAPVRVDSTDLNAEDIVTIDSDSNSDENEASHAVEIKSKPSDADVGSKRVEEEKSSNNPVSSSETEIQQSAKNIEEVIQQPENGDQDMDNGMEVDEVACSQDSELEKPKEAENSATAAKEKSAAVAAVVVSTADESEVVDCGDVTESMNCTSDSDMIATCSKENANNLDESAVDDCAKIDEVNQNAQINIKNVKGLDESVDCSITSSSNDKLLSEEALKDKLKERFNLITNGSSTPNNVTSSNVYNSTPISKQFAISSENVSKITQSVDNSQTEHTSLIQEKEVVNMVASTSSSAHGDTEQSQDNKTSDSAEIDSCSASSATDNQTSDELTRYAKNIKKFNGISSTTSAVAENSVDDKSKVILSTVENGITDLDLTNALTSEDFYYEVGVWFDGADLKFLSVEKLDHKITKTANSTTEITDTSKHSSNGSVSSFGPFSLPEPRTSIGATSSTSNSTTASGSTIKSYEFLVPPARKAKQTIKGSTALCNFMIQEFTKIKQTLSIDDTKADLNHSFETKTPRGRPTKESKNMGGSAKGTKRSLSKVLNSPDEDEKSVRAPKQAKRGPKPADKTPPTPSKPTSPIASPAMTTAEEFAQLEKIDQCCLARWTDRKYYAGRVTEAKAGNKFVVLFEDGASKSLANDIIVFGQDDILPILDHSIHALTGGDTYEPGIVTAVKRNDENVVVYSVLIESGNVDVTASDMYLNEEQAKLIHTACKELTQNETDKAMMQSPAASNKRGTTTASYDTTTTGKGARSTRSKRGDKSQQAATPEAGFSGGVGKKGRRGRSKPQAQTTFSESSDISDTLESDSAPNSPDSGLEAIDGVQPELQKTPKESEISIAEYLGNDKSKSLEDILGPIPTNKTIFRNKHFILTCTIPVKGISSSKNSAEDMKNKDNKFTTLPFVKEHLKNQIEAGGGKVYQHFEDVPKAKYKQSKLIAPHPSKTAKYVQCLAVDIQAVSHEWIIECCQKLTLLDTKNYVLPSGWSIIEDRYIRWACGRGIDQRNTTNPFSGTNVMIGSLNKDFTEFWSRVCKFGGATIRLIKSENDVTQNLNGYMLTDQEFPEEIKLKAGHFGLPIVSTVWVVQSLILGKICRPDSHEKLTQIYQDDDY